MNHKAYADFISAPAKDRLAVFGETANRLGTPVGNIEKDFWVCWTLDALYNRLADDNPRMLFKGGTSLSKAYGLSASPKTSTSPSSGTIWIKQPASPNSRPSPATRGKTGSTPFAMPAGTTSPARCGINSLDCYRR